MRWPWMIPYHCTVTRQNESKKSVKQVGSQTSAKLGTLVTVAIAFNTTVNIIPLIFVFPNTNYRNASLLMVYLQAQIRRTNPTGWIQITSSNFSNTSLGTLGALQKEKYYYCWIITKLSFLSKELNFLITIWFNFYHSKSPLFSQTPLTDHFTIYLKNSPNLLVALGCVKY